MGCQKLLQCLHVVIIAIVIMGCTAPAGMPTALATPTPSPISTEVQTVTPHPTPTSVSISSFEECFALGYEIHNTYPRQCIRNNGEIFTEALDEGVIFSKTYDNQGRFITITRDGGYLIAGSSTGCWILNLDAHGEKVWDSSFGQELSEEFQLSQIDFWCWMARQTPGGEYVAMGTAYDANFGQFRKPFVITLDDQGHMMSGQVITEKQGKTPYLDRDGNLIWLTSMDMERKVIETSDGGYVIVGKSPQDPEGSTHMIKTDKNGDYLWDRNLCLDKNIHQAWEEHIVCAYSIVVDGIQLQDGSFVVIGSTWFLKTDPSGNLEWIRAYQRKYFNGQAVIQLPDNGFLIAGDIYVDQEKQTDGMLTKTDPTGNLQWLRTYGGNQDDRFTAMEQRPNGEIIILGSTEAFGARTWLLGIDSGTLR